MSTDWHVHEDDLRWYAAGDATPPVRWSVEAHVAACPACRRRLTDLVTDSIAGPAWANLDAELDAPVPGFTERMLGRFGVPEHTARLVAATPALRAAWLLAVASTLALMALLANLSGNAATPYLFVAIAPVLPLAGVAASFGPRIDPTYEISLAAPMNTFRLLLLRTVAVLVTTTALSAAATLAVPGLGVAAVAWFLPALTLTSLTLALTARMRPVHAAEVVGAAWLVAVWATAQPSAAGSALFSAAGQAVLVAVGVLSTVVVVLIRPRYETSRRFAPATTRRRNP
jgi:hypothetical protein